MSWEFPSVEPPDYLRRLSPDLYREEAARVAARFDEAVQLAEQMFLAELSDLVSHLSERLSGQGDGKPKIFRDSAVENLTEFFQRFRRLHVGGEDQLEEIVSRAEAAPWASTLSSCAKRRVCGSGSSRTSQRSVKRSTSSWSTSRGAM